MMTRTLSSTMNIRMRRSHSSVVTTAAAVKVRHPRRHQGRMTAQGREPVQDDAAGACETETGSFFFRSFFSPHLFSLLPFISCPDYPLKTWNNYYQVWVFVYPRNEDKISGASSLFGMLGDNFGWEGKLPSGTTK